VQKIRVLVVDDSALVRSLLRQIIDRQSDMVCIGTASDPLIARNMIRELDPDVVTLDVEMPRMDGLEFLRRLMRLRPTPVIMISTLTEHGAEAALRALELGAVDYVAKPRADVAGGFNAIAALIVEKLRVAAGARVSRSVADNPMAASTTAVRPAVAATKMTASSKLIAIGASTGGTEAIREILVRLPADFPAIVITQHMPAGFTTTFAARLDSLCAIRVKEASHGETILRGHAYIAPGGLQFYVKPSARGYVACVEDAPPVNRHKPSVEVLFQSIARVAGPSSAIGIMLTGMGDDGARAMLEMKQAGAYNFVQDEASCVVFGMPREAILAGAADEVLPLADIAEALIAHVA